MSTEQKIFSEREMSCMMHLGTYALLETLFRKLVDEQMSAPEAAILVKRLSQVAIKSAMQHADGDFSILRDHVSKIFEDKIKEFEQ